MQYNDEIKVITLGSCEEDEFDRTTLKGMSERKRCPDEQIAENSRLSQVGGCKRIKKTHNLFFYIYILFKIIITIISIWIH